MDVVRTDVTKEMASSVIKFDGQFRGPQTQINCKTYENYVLKKINGKWLIDYFQSYHFPIENNKNYSSIHLLKVPSNQSIASLNAAVQKINQAIAKIGYPGFGYSIMNIIPEKNEKFNYVMTGKWGNEQIYNTIHNDPEFKKAIEEVKNTLVPFFNDEIYVKYINRP